MTKPSFSERMGLKSPKAVQVMEMDRDLRIGLWNALTYYVQELRTGDALHAGFEDVLRFRIWTKFLKWPYDQFPPSDARALGQFEMFWPILRKWYFGWCLRSI